MVAGARSRHRSAIGWSYESHEGSRPDASYHDRFGYRQERFQVHGIDANEKVVVRKQLRRSQVIAFFAALAPCLIGMEACATAHYWARELTKLGHKVRLMLAFASSRPETVCSRGWPSGGFSLGVGFRCSLYFPRCQIAPAASGRREAAKGACSNFWPIVQLALPPRAAEGVRPGLTPIPRNSRCPEH